MENEDCLQRLLSPLELATFEQQAERQGESVSPLYGAVTTGTLWRFLALEGNDAREYHIDRLGPILGVLLAMVGLVPGQVS